MADEETIQGKLDYIIEVLKRMESRQVEIKKEVDQTQTGSFGSTNQ